MIVNDKMHLFLFGYEVLFCLEVPALFSILALGTDEFAAGTNMTFLIKIT